jgi:hypothetical protein
MPITVWKLQLAVGVLVVPLLEGLFAWLLIGSAASLYPDAWKVLSGAARRVWRRDALVALCLSLAAGAALSRIDAVLTNVLHAYVAFDDELFPQSFTTLWPAAGIFLSILTRTLLFSAAAGIAIFIVRAGWKRRAWWLWSGLLLILVSLGPTNAHSLAEFGAGWIMSLLPLVMAALVVGVFIRDNVLAYLVVLFGIQSARSLITLFSQPNKYFLQNGTALALLVGVMLVWMLWTSGRTEKIPNN